MKNKFIIYIMLALLALTSLAGCTKKDEKEVSKDENKAEAATETKNAEEKIEEVEKNETKEQSSSPLKLGVMFSQNDGLDPTTVTSPGGMLLMFTLYDSLVTIDKDGYKFRIAESIEPNEDFTEYKVVLKKDLKYSDGTEVTGQDVVNSLNYLAKSPMYQSVYGKLDTEKSSADGFTARLVLKQPASDFVLSCLGMYSPVAKGGKFDGVGPGGYVIEKGDAQTGYTLRPNEYYYAGKPEIPEITILNIPDSSSKVKALQTGEIDYAWGLDASAIKVLSTIDNIELPKGTLDSASALELVLNTRVAPFNDPEVRRAAKLTVDRERLVKTLLGEYGVLGNDMLGKGYKTYPNEILQTTPNKEEAKKIFEEKGVKEFDLSTSDIMPGLNNAAKLMAEDFAEVGVKVNIEELDPQTYFSQMGEIYQKSAFSFYWINRIPVTEFASVAIKASPYNVSGYTSDEIEKNYNELLSTNDEKNQEELVKLISQEMHEQGGDLIWGFQMGISANRKGFSTETTQSVPFLATAKFVPEAK